MLRIYKLNKYIGEQAETLSGEMEAGLNTKINEVEPDTIPLAHGVDLEALKAADDDPLEVVASIPASKSTRGWYYTPRCLEDIVNYVNNNTLNGFLGHQKPEDISNQFLPPVTHWIGAKLEGETAYFRGLIDAAATDLKRWIRTKRIKEVSIFGKPTIAKDNQGNVNVIGYEPLSIDWTPLHRPGMKTQIVGLSGEMDGTLEGLKESIEEAVKERFKVANPNKYVYVWVRQIRYDTNIVVADIEIDGEEEKTLSMPYSLNDNKVLLGEAVEVKQVITYEPVEPEKEEGGLDQMTPEELLNQLGEKIANGEMKAEEVEAALKPKNKEGKEGEEKETKEETEVLEEIKEELGVKGEMSLLDAIKELNKNKAEAEAAKHKEKVKNIVEAEVTGEIAQDLVIDLLGEVDATLTEEEIKGEIAEVLERPSIKAVLSNSYLDKGTGTGGEGTDNTGNVRTIRKSI